MTKVVGVRFRNVGKIYYFSPKDYEIKTGDHVIVETARGIEYGKVVLAPREVGEEDVVHPLKEVLRVATKEDDEREAQNRVREREAFKICQKKIRHSVFFSHSDTFILQFFHKRLIFRRYLAHCNLLHFSSFFPDWYALFNANHRFFTV